MLNSRSSKLFLLLHNNICWWSVEMYLTLNCLLTWLSWGELTLSSNKILILIELFALVWITFQIRCWHLFEIDLMMRTFSVRTILIFTLILGFMMTNKTLFMRSWYRVLGDTRSLCASHNHGLFITGTLNWLPSHFIRNILLKSTNHRSLSLMLTTLHSRSLLLKESIGMTHCFLMSWFFTCSNCCSCDSSLIFTFLVTSRSFGWHKPFLFFRSSNAIFITNWMRLFKSSALYRLSRWTWRSTWQRLFTCNTSLLSIYTLSYLIHFHSLIVVHFFKLLFLYVFSLLLHVRVTNLEVMGVCFLNLLQLRYLGRR